MNSIIYFQHTSSEIPYTKPTLSNLNDYMYECVHECNSFVCVQVPSFTVLCSIKENECFPLPINTQVTNFLIQKRLCQNCNHYVSVSFVYVQVPSFTGLFQPGSNSSGCPHVLHACGVED